MTPAQLKLLREMKDGQWHFPAQRQERLYRKLELLGFVESDMRHSKTDNIKGTITFSCAFRRTPNGLENI